MNKGESDINSRQYDTTGKLISGLPKTRQYIELPCQRDGIDPVGLICLAYQSKPEIFKNTKHDIKDKIATN